MTEIEIVPKCPEGHQMERKEAMFYWRGKFRPGFVCPICKSLFVVPGEEIPPLRRRPIDVQSS